MQRRAERMKADEMVVVDARREKLSDAHWMLLCKEFGFSYFFV